MTTDNYDFSGTWHSARTFFHVYDKKDSTTEHDMTIHRTGNSLVMQSVPNEDEPGAYTLWHLTLDGRVLTGTYHESSMPDGPFKGKQYYGALQLLIDEDGNAMRGKWVGLDTDLHMQSNEVVVTRT